jgi:hypothetical protein
VFSPSSSAFASEVVAVRRCAASPFEHCGQTYNLRGVARIEAEQRARSLKGGRKSRSTDPTRSVEKVSMKISGT